MRSSVNPFYAACESAVASPIRKTYALLPKAPVTASPVPHLTSLYHSDDGMEYGDRRYPGNCGGRIIRDLLRDFQPGNVFDPMTGSGTCAEVSRTALSHRTAPFARSAVNFRECPPTFHPAFSRASAASSLPPRAAYNVKWASANDTLGHPHQVAD